MLLSLGLVSIYVVLVCIAAFLEKSLSRDLAGIDLNALTRVGACVLGIAAYLVIHGIAVPDRPSLLAGLGIGVIMGGAAILYVVALGWLRVSTVVSVANAYIIVTAALGIVILGEALTVLKVLGLVLTIAGVALLCYRQPGSGSQSRSRGRRLLAYGVLGGYILVVGVGTFLEKPALRGLDPLGLNALSRIGQVAVAGSSLAVWRRPLQYSWYSLGAIAVGAMVGLGAICYYLGLRHLPVSVAAAVANTSVIVTVLLSVIVQHVRMTWERVGGIAVTLVGVGLLALGK